MDTGDFYLFIYFCAGWRSKKSLLGKLLRWHLAPVRQDWGHDVAKKHKLQRDACPSWRLKRYQLRPDVYSWSIFNQQSLQKQKTYDENSNTVNFPGNANVFFFSDKRGRTGRIKWDEVLMLFPAVSFNFLWYQLNSFLYRKMDVLISLNNGKSFISSAHTISATTCVSLMLSSDISHSRLNLKSL